MTNERHRRAKELFATAREFSSERANEFLDAACGDDDQLRREVALLVALHRELERAETGPPPTRDIGPFRITRLLGEGGMGEVWAAEQEAPLRREVALKLVKWGLDTREVLARFEAERQALALMHHPNIAAVYEAGAADDGRPYFAMELVEGEQITTFCDRGRLSVEERLELFARVCDGVQHAHQKGVIHRDLKPSNILVAADDGGTPRPKIIDFGVAKAISQRLTERTVATQLGHWIGTPEYMSPEQAALDPNDVDTRSDVYSLGVILYELLVGEPPLDRHVLNGADFDEMRRMIREDEPRRPSTMAGRTGAGAAEAAAARRTNPGGLRRSLHGDLDWVVLKALEKDRARRYDSPSELAADIRRHLGHEPVMASPPGTLYRFRKYVRRHRLGVAAASVALAAVVAGGIMAGAGLVRARDEAEASRRVSGILESILLDLNPRSRTGSAARVPEIIDRGVERVESELSERPLEEARMLLALGVARAGFGDLDGARPLIERSRELRLHHLGPDHLDFAESSFYLGDLLIDAVRTDDALRYHEAALDIRARQLPPNHRLVVLSAERVAMCRGAIDDCEGARLAVQRVFEGTRDGRADAEIEAAILGAAGVACWCDDLPLARSLVETTAVYRSGFAEAKSLGDAISMFNFAAVVDQLGQSARAADLAERALASWQDLGGPRDRDFAAALYATGRVNLNAGRTARAREILMQAVELDGRIAERPEVLARWRHEISHLFVALGDADTAVALLAEAVDNGLPTEEILDDPELEGIRTHPGYAALVAGTESHHPSEPSSDGISGRAEIVP